MPLGAGFGEVADLEGVSVATHYLRDAGVALPELAA